ncbi:hypothetical protein BJP39_01060 [Streptomyces sp. CC77]|nr:hypothetical protein BJP39_01060 [Streptomyces sp. CC77]
MDVASTTVLCGDVIQIGDRPHRVKDIIDLPGRAKRLIFATGETFTMHPRTRLTVVRTVRRA